MKIDKGTIYSLELFMIDISGEPITGLSNTYTIYDSSTELMIASGSLTDQGLGIYTSTYQFNDAGQYRIIFNTPSGYTDEIESIIVEEPHLNLLKRILGLVQENFRIFETTYDTNQNLTRSIVKTYNNASDCDDNINSLAEYEIIATYDLTGKMLSYKSKKL